MEKSTIIGVVLAGVSIGFGMVLKGASLGALLNPAAALIIFGGTAAALFNAFSLEEIKKIPGLLKIIFTEQALMPKRELIEKFVDWVSITRREGLLSLEKQAEELSDPFMKSGMRLIIDGNDPDFVRDVLLEDIAEMETRHKKYASIFTQAGTYAPTLGVLGAVVGLIAALGNLSEVEKLGHLISAAFVATMFGIFLGYVVFHPFANKLKTKSKKEVEIKLMIVEGLLSIQSGVSANSVKQKMMIFVANKDREKFEEGEKEGGARE
ncbi:flagellar motor stator protein MotA [Paenibacillus roseipurpureus]|uniref:Flagellar motor stator protein MotA n=1 Tax=Paenibacillus roseopurpureus TaxID=2918901 RepID=A0AA96RJG7_9BACL|nr:flagellar motor stator protein MotA [Paenibacillus sp. MBLB1832]WNR43294.1 flagellar motor stator protein MotA [Paenibacillus sp. MBLB1832]